LLPSLSFPFSHLLWWFCYKEDNGIKLSHSFFFFSPFFFFFFGPFVAKKAGSLKLTINNDMVVFLKNKVLMARGRRLKKVGGDLKA
jgi:hypothetical protein